MTRQAVREPVGSRVTATLGDADVPAADTDFALRALELAKSYGATRALRGCSLELRRGEIHALMGENGSGKSTLVKLLAGVHQPDGGEIELLGTRHTHFASPRAAAELGIATVFQEILVVPQQSVLTNVWLGGDGLVRRRRSTAERRRRAQEILGRLVGKPSLDVPAGQLSLSDRQAVCIARALVSEPTVLILDEATSALDLATRTNLFEILEGLRSRGIPILFISHRMDEVAEIADRITVLRSGEKVATGLRGELTARELVEHMTGTEHVTENDHASRRGGQGAGPVLIRTEGVRLAEGQQPIEIEVRAGELVGLAGLEGHGQDRFLQVLAGARPAAGRVICASDGGERAIRSRSDARRHGVAYVPRDRRDESIFETRSTLDNFQLTTVRADRRMGLVRRALARRRFETYAETLKISAGRRTNLVTSLSGGNQQKVVLARWLALRPRVLLLNDPTRGIDMAAKLDIYRVLTRAADEGVAVVMLSTELVELIELMDRVLVFRENGLFADLRREELTRTRLVAGYFGREET
jgi:ABC-type sugar transport system ATPase subunit